MPVLKGDIIVKKFLAVLAAACLVFGTVGCQQNDVSTGQEQTSAVSNDTIIPKVKEEETESETKSETASETESETATAPQDDEINIETLAEGEERDYNIEDILKNDLEIDGIPISIPCTLNELLETLGDDYSVDKSEIENDFEGKADTKSKYFTGECLCIRLYYKGKDAYCLLNAIADPEKIDYDTINIIGFFGGSRYGVINLSDLHVGDGCGKCVEKYGNPNEVYEDDGTIFLTYKNSNCLMEFRVVDNKIKKIYIIGYKTEDL